MPSLSDVEAVFQAALEKGTGQERVAFLDQACKGDGELRRQVERLLHAQHQLGSFLEQPAAAQGATSDHVAPGRWIDPAATPPPAEGPGSRIGPYKLLQQVGEGGMGVVFMAEQEQPVRRKVALKIVKPGMDSGQVIARFEAERQALALMDHHHIARVLDAGTTASGRPYFVMELVKGVPITKFCDEQHLSPRERLELFVPVCQAIQHAHQKGIIHRDIKPSNVLVTLYDGRPVPKVIDFGVAKAIEQRLTERTLFTQLGQVVGTLEYMSPEQAELNQLDIDTRSDIYSLGVLLYELLTGSTPLEKQMLRSAAFAEMLRMIREEEPPRPSTRLSASADKLPTISAQRKTEPGKLAKLVRGELDWIVMKTLEKDRGRRYETANGFARDIQRYLADEPVQACPPSAAYRLRKFARKNRKALFTAGAFVLLLAALSGAAGWVLSDRSARQRETERAVQAALEEAAAWQKQRRLPEALSAVRRADGLVRSGTAEEALRRQVHARLADLVLLERLENARLEGAAVKDDRFDATRTHALYGDAFRVAGLDVEGLPPPEAAEQLRRTTVAAELAAILDDWASHSEASSREHLLEVGREVEPEGTPARVRDALRDMQRQALVDLAASELALDLLPATVRALSFALETVEAPESARGLLQEARGRHPDDFWLNEELGLLLFHSQPPQLEESIRFYTVAVSLRPGSPGAHLNLGIALAVKGRLDEAIAEFREAVRLKNDYADAHNSLGGALQAKGRADEAIAEVREAIRLRKDLPAGHYNLGNLLRAKGRLDEAIAEYREAIRLGGRQKLPKAYEIHASLGAILCDGKGDYDGAIAEFRAAIRLKKDYALAHNNLGNALQAKGRLDEAVAEHREAIRLQKDLPDAHNSLGVALAHKDLLDEAIAEFREAIRLKKDYASAHKNLANALKTKGQLEEAIAEFREAIRLEPDHAFAHYGLGLALEDKGRLDEAIAEYREAIRLKKDAAAAHISLGAIVCDGKGDYDGAIAEFRAAIRLKKDDAVAHFNLGQALVHKGQLDEALTEFRQAARLKPDYAEARHNLGTALRAKGQLEEAIAEFRAAVRLKPDYALAHNNLGNALAQKGQMDEALTEFRAAIRLQKDFREAHFNCAIALRIKGRIDEAIAEYREAIRLNKDDARAHCDLGSLLCDGKGDYDGAIAEFRAAIRRKKDYAEAHCDLGLALAHKGRPGEAMAAFREALRLDAGFRYYAACAAAIAACGQGKDTAKLDGKERAGLRQQALDWLRADLEAKRPLLEKDANQAGPALHRQMQEWLEDPDLAGVRGEALAQLPEVERQAWRKLWADVAELMARARGPAAAEKKRDMK
jgi:tetratricopeptide (TPR) repeat protein